MGYESGVYRSASRTARVEGTRDRGGDSAGGLGVMGADNADVVLLLGGAALVR